MDGDYNKLLSHYNLLRTVAEGLGNQLVQAVGLLQMSSEFMQSIDYETPIDAAQCGAIIMCIDTFLKEVTEDE